MVDAEQKLEMLWSFVKSHLQEKVIVFCSSCKQVLTPTLTPNPSLNPNPYPNPYPNPPTPTPTPTLTYPQVQYMHGVFSALRPGTSLLCLHGRQKQMKRLATYTQFCQKAHVVLFATDVAARGLDFPQVGEPEPYP